MGQQCPIAAPLEHRADAFRRGGLCLPLAARCGRWLSAPTLAAGEN